MSSNLVEGEKPYHLSFLTFDDHLTFLTFEDQRGKNYAIYVCFVKWEVKTDWIQCISKHGQEL